MKRVLIILCIVIFFSGFSIASPIHEDHSCTKTIIGNAGPSGGTGGGLFYLDPLSNERIQAITVVSSSYIIRIELEFKNQSTNIVRTVQCGGNGSGTSSRFLLQPNEYIIQVLGTHDNRYLTSLWIKTNTNNIKYWGNWDNRDPAWTVFRYHLPPTGVINGFWGRAGDLVDALGVVCKSELIKVPCRLLYINNNRAEEEILKKSSYLEKILDVPSSPGFCGPSGFGSGEYTFPVTATKFRLNQVRIWSGDVIDAIQVVYYNSATGNQHVAEKLGGNGGALSTISLENSEYIYQVSGSYTDCVRKLNVLIRDANTGEERVLSFGRSSTQDPVFTYTAPPLSRINGFWGVGDRYVNALGVKINE